jgi:hypothetical protein
MKSLPVLACFVFVAALQTLAADKQMVTVRSVSTTKGEVSVIAELRGKTIHLSCFATASFCAEPAQGEYRMVRAINDEDAIYQDCTDVILYKASGAIVEKVGVYCWQDSGDCYIVSCSAVRVETFRLPFSQRVAPNLPLAAPLPPSLYPNLSTVQSLVPSVQDWQDCKPNGSYSFTDLKQSVRRVVTSGGYFGWDDKMFSRSGDLASVAVLQNFSEKEMTAPEALEGVLLVLRTAFTCPHRCVNANGDEQPRVTLLLLDRLREVANPAMRSKIDDVEKFVVEQARGVE